RRAAIQGRWLFLPPPPGGGSQEAKTANSHAPQIHAPCGRLRGEDDISPSFLGLQRAELLRHDGANLVGLLGHEVEPSRWREHLPSALDKESGDCALRIIRRIRQHDVEGSLRQSLDASGGNDLEASDAVDSCVVFRQSYRP